MKTPKIIMESDFQVAISKFQDGAITYGEMTLKTSLLILGMYSLITIIGVDTPFCTSNFNLHKFKNWKMKKKTKKER